MAHFGLIHGAWHGGWCWSKTASLLREAGHQVSAPDLPGHGARGRRRWRAGGVSMGDYIDSVADMVLCAPAPLILVGHSMGGMVITGAAERHRDKVASCVYCCAFLPPSGSALGDLAPEVSPITPDDQQTSWWRGAVRIKAGRVAPIFYGECSAEDIAMARAHLSWQSLRAFGEPVSWTSERFGRVRKYAIICERDRAIHAAGQEKMARDGGVAEADMVRLMSDHSPFFSHPRELADILLRWA